MDSFDIIKSLQSKLKHGEKITAIFDLDSTLFDVSPRIAKILNDFGATAEFQISHPAETDILAQIVAHPTDFGVKKTLERNNFPIRDMDFVDKIVEFWKREFFSGNYLKYDKPYAGAVDFVKNLQRIGAKILYLTGRDAPRMKKKTIESLIEHGFPLSSNAENLFLKPDTSISDVEFKKRFFQSFVAASEIEIGKIKTQDHIIFFENEPANIVVAIQAIPDIEIIFLDTVHSETTPVPPATISRINRWT